MKLNYFLFCQLRETSVRIFLKIQGQFIQYQFYYMQAQGASLMGLNLTEIFQLQPIQSLLIKFWYLGLTSECVIAAQDTTIYRTIKKSISFANCFTFQMPIKSFILYMQRILRSLQKLNAKKTFEMLIKHLNNNKVPLISFELFGVCFLQLFGRIPEIIDCQTMCELIRQVYISITQLHKNGTAIIKSAVREVQPLDFQSLISNLKELQERQILQNEEKNRQSDQYINGDNPQVKQQINLKTLKGRHQFQKNYNFQMRNSTSDQYPIGDKMKKQQKANISCFVMGGFQIVDYSQSINQLHKKLLTKILLNK